jgi:hypothetical protein
MSVKEHPAFQHLNWNPDRKELRSFAIAMLIGFAFLGLLTAWREHAIGTHSFGLWAVGGMLALFSLVPGLGRIAYLVVYIASSAIGFVVSRVLLAAVFYLLFVPLGFALRLGLVGHQQEDTSTMGPTRGGHGAEAVLPPILRRGNWKLEARSPRRVQ